MALYLFGPKRGIRTNTGTFASTKPHWEIKVKRNWEVIRAILLRLESAETPNIALNSKDIAEFPEQEVAYNMRLLSESGYIQANILESKSGSGQIAVALARRLTNSGHELLDTIRNETVWGAVKDKFSKSGLEMTFDLVIAVGKKVMETMLQ